MQYIIIIGIVIVVAILAFKLIIYALGFILLLISNLLFHPVINSLVTAVFLIFAGAKALRAENLFVLFLAAIALADCIRDIVIGGKYYKGLDLSDFDKLFVIKSLTSLLTLGFARIVFLLIVGPVLSLTVASDINSKMAHGLPLPLPALYNKLQARNYYYAKYIEKLDAECAVVSNAETVDSEIKKRRERLDGLYPKKLMEKLAEKIAGDNDVKENRQRAEEKLQPNAIQRYYTYLSTPAFNRLQAALSNVMLHKGCFSPSDIQRFEELRGLNLMSPVDGRDGGNSDWGEYFIIQALQPLVANGTFSDDGDLSDRDAFETHAYEHIHTSAPRKSQSPETNPLLALDDDDDL